MDVQILGHIGVNDVEKLAELYAAVAAVALADYLAIGSIEEGSEDNLNVSLRCGCKANALKEA